MGPVGSVRVGSGHPDPSRPAITDPTREKPYLVVYTILYHPPESVVVVAVEGHVEWDARYEVERFEEEFDGMHGMGQKELGICDYLR